MKNQDPRMDHDQIEAMARHRRMVSHARSYAERMKVAKDLEVEFKKMLQANPEAYRSFLARNYRKRRIDEVAKLEHVMRGSHD